MRLLLSVRTACSCDEPLDLPVPDLAIGFLPNAGSDVAGPACSGSRSAWSRRTYPRRRSTTTPRTATRTCRGSARCSPRRRARPASPASAALGHVLVAADGHPRSAWPTRRPVHEVPVVALLLLADLRILSHVLVLLSSRSPIDAGHPLKYFVPVEPNSPPTCGRGVRRSPCTCTQCSWRPEEGRPPPWRLSR